MPAEPQDAGWLRRAVAWLRGDAPPPAPVRRPRAVARLDRIAADLDRLQHRYGDSPPKDSQDAR